MAIILFICVISSYESTELMLGRVYFTMPDTIVTQESEKVLKLVADKMQAEPNIMIDIYGVTNGQYSPRFDTSGMLAGQVQKYLVNNLGVPTERIHTPKYPIHRPTIPKNQVKDQWADIVVSQPDAILVWFENDVRVQPPALRPNWLDPIKDYYLYHGYKVTTGKKSTAHILYPGKGTLRMDEDAMVVIHSLTLQRKEKQSVKNFKLQDGTLTALLRDIATQIDTVAITMTEKEIVAQLQDTLVADKLEDLVDVYQSNADVADLNREPTKQILDDSIISMEDRLDGLTIPPAIPTLVSPELNEKKYYPSEITFIWRPSAALSHLQVAEDSLFQHIAFDAYAASESLVTALAENLYYWRVSGVNADSLEGDFTDYWTFAVELDTLKPHLEIAIMRNKHKETLIAYGSTEVDADLFINDEKIEKAIDGSFSYALPDELRDKVIARAVDPAGNATVKVCRIPDRPAFAMGINTGLCLVTNDKVSAPEIGFWYGARISRMLWPNVSFFTSTTVARTNGKTGDTLNMTDIISIEIGFRANFNVGRLSPFFYVQSGFAWSQTNIARQNHPGIINYGQATHNPTAGFGTGAWFNIGRHWYLNLHADYLHIFTEDSDSDNPKTFTRIGIGVQDRML